MWHRATKISNKPCCKLLLNPSYKLEKVEIFKIYIFTIFLPFTGKIHIFTNLPVNLKAGKSSALVYRKLDIVAQRKINGEIS
jgi:hypothetical protein